MRIGFRPWEFWKLTPVELHEAVDEFYLLENERKKFIKKEFRWLATKLYNVSGKALKKLWKETNFYRFEEEIPRPKTKEELEKRKEDLIETFFIQKKHNWMKVHVCPGYGTFKELKAKYPEIYKKIFGSTH